MKHKILFVVDDREVLDGLSRLLHDQKNFWEMTFFTSADDAMGNCLVNDYDVVVSDISMPEKTGFELLQNLREINRTKDTPVVVMTGPEDTELKNRALQLGATDLLNKPASREDLLARLQNCIRLKTYVNEIRNHKKSLEQRVQERTCELEETRLQVIHRLSRGAEFKDHETGMHVIRMSKYSAVLGLKAGLSAKECTLLLHAAPMHDIGKIGIPDNVLSNLGKLDAEDREIMQTHVAIGAEILSGDDSELIKTARAIAFQHHEKWDGTGYPHGLKGTEISIEARIVALCDVFDGLTTEKPYKEARSFEEAARFVEEQRGKHFDPTMVDHFLEILPNILEIQNRYSDNAEIRRLSIS